MKGLIRWLAKLKVAKRPDSVSSASTTKRRTKREIERRRQVFDDARPHHGDDLIAALEFENFMRDDYTEGAK